MSIRTKTIFGIALIEIALLVTVCTISIKELKKSSTEDLYRESVVASELLIAATINSVLSTDLASLESLTSEFTASSDIVYVRIYNHQGLMANSGSSSHLPEQFEADSVDEIPADGVYDFSSPITLAGYNYGHIEIGLDSSRIDSRIDAVTNNLIIISIIGIITSVFLSFLLGHRLTQQFQIITCAASELIKGNFGHKIDVIGNDELATAAASFNIMSEKIQQLLTVSAEQQREIEDRETLLRTLLESLPAGILFGDEDRVAVFSNQKMAHIFGWDAITDFDVEGREFRSLLPLLLNKTKKPEEFLKFINKSISSESSITSHQIELYNQKIIEIDYVPIHFQESGITKHLWYFKDVTKILSSEKASQKAAMELATIFNLSPNGIAYFNLDGIIQHVNSAFRSLSGIAENDIEGSHLQELDDIFRAATSDTSIIPFTNYSNEIISSYNTGTRQELVHTFQIKKGTTIHIERTIIFDSSDGFSGGFVYLKDITEIKKLEIMKSEFLSTTAHELRSPMANIYGYSELLLDTDFEKSQQKELISIIHEQTQRLVYIINDLLDLARIESKVAGEVSMKPTNIRETIIKFLKGFDSNPKTHPIYLDKKPNIPEFSFDKNKIHQVLNNVISNAIKYSPNGGDILISTSPNKRQNIEGVSVEIKDNGIGMSDEQIDRIFERFYRADNSGKIPGTGLGMSIVKEIVDLHGGEVSVSSREKVGTTVSLWLPFL